MLLAFVELINVKSAKAGRMTRKGYVKAEGG
jgi:hypothetical protein